MRHLDEFRTYIRLLQYGITNTEQRPSISGSKCILETTQLEEQALEQYGIFVLTPHTLSLGLPLHRVTIIPPLICCAYANPANFQKNYLSTWTSSVFWQLHCVFFSRRICIVGIPFLIWARTIIHMLHLFVCCIQFCMLSISHNSLNVYLLQIYICTHIYISQHLQLTFLAHSFFFFKAHSFFF